MGLKQKTLEKFLTEPAPNSKKEITINNNSEIVETYFTCKDENIYLYIKEYGRKSLICKMNRMQYEKLIGLGYNISPEAVSEIFPGIHNKSVLLICEAVISSLRTSGDNFRI
ncbi:MAG: hypothetical protein ACTSPY_04165 [Candidatus Helarchaeota archaeon]